MYTIYESLWGTSGFQTGNLLAVNLTPEVLQTKRKMKRKIAKDSFFFDNTMSTSYTMIQYTEETHSECLVRMERLFQRYLAIKDNLHQHTLDGLDELFKERFRATVFRNPLPLSKFNDHNLSSLGKDEFVTEEDIVREYRCNIEGVNFNLTFSIASNLISRVHRQRYY